MWYIVEDEKWRSDLILRNNKKFKIKVNIWDIDYFGIKLYVSMHITTKWQVQTNRSWSISVDLVQQGWLSRGGINHIQNKYITIFSIWSTNKKYIQ